MAIFLSHVFHQNFHLMTMNKADGGFRKKGNELLRSGDFDLIYFSTTAFHVCRLGPYWKKKFKVPFIIDMQDPWRNDFYLDKPRSQRPPKFFISYNIDKYLEATTIPFADGIISVSEGYKNELLQRYPSLLPEKYFFIGDEAFVCEKQLLVPFSGRGIGTMKDSFNFHLSARRQVIERYHRHSANRVTSPRI